MNQGKSSVNLKMYSYNEIKYINKKYPWNDHQINIILDKDAKNNKHEHFFLYPTGYADLHGRKYISLPTTLVITNEIKVKYNLI